MNQNFIFVFILLAALSMVNAVPLQKRTTSFEKCPPIPGAPSQPEQISVSISPDPIVPGKDDTFTVSGTLTKEITSKHNLIIGFSDLSGNILGFYIEDMPPTKPNTPFKVVKAELAPDYLPSAYAIVVAISTMNNPKADVIGCSFTVVGSSVASYPIAELYPIAS